MNSQKNIFVHLKGICESDLVGEGTRIWAFAHIMKGAVVGKNCNIGECSFIEKGAVLGDNCTVKNHVAVWEKVTCEDFVFLGPSCVLTNDLTPRVEFKKNPDKDFLPTTIKRGATIGANAVILCGIVLGRYCMVGAGAVVTKDIPDYGLVFGNPGKLVGYACRCGAPIRKELLCEKCSRQYRYKEHYKGKGLNPYGLEALD